MLSRFSHVWLSATPWTVVHEAPLSMGILQARMLEGTAMPSCRGSSEPRDWTCVSCTAGECFTAEAQKYRMTSLYVESKKWYNWTYLQNRNRFTELDKTLWLPGKGEGQAEAIVREFGMDMYILLYLKWITNKDLHWTMFSVIWQPGWEGSLGENGCVYVLLSPFAVCLKLFQHRLLISYASEQNIKFFF